MRCSPEPGWLGRATLWFVNILPEPLRRWIGARIWDGVGRTIEQQFFDRWFTETCRIAPRFTEWIITDSQYSFRMRLEQFGGDSLALKVEVKHKTEDDPFVHQQADALLERILKRYGRILYMPMSLYDDTRRSKRSILGPIIGLSSSAPLHKKWERHAIDTRTVAGVSTD